MGPNTLLLTVPNGFRVEYAINPHMKNDSGALHIVDEKKAQQQWMDLRDLYKRLGMKVEIIEGRPEYPDMVFCANQTFPFVDRTGNPALVMSRMKAEQRQGEVAYYEAWAREKNLKVHQLSEVAFEGCGDALWNYETGEIFAGYGIRTQLSAYDQLKEIVGAPIHLLELVSEKFYHLDTCLVILDEDTAAYVPEAFTATARETLEQKFATLFKIDILEASRNFAGNAFCPDGENVILQKGSRFFASELRTQGFRVHEMDTSEFIKAGGSVFCMKQCLWL